MKQLKYFVALMFAACFTTACVDDFRVGDAFLEKAPGVDVNIDTIFSKAEYTRNFLWSAYGQIYCTYHKGNMMNGAPIDVLSDSYHCYCGWGGPIQSYYPGNLTEDCQDTPDGNLPRSIDLLIRASSTALSTPFETKSSAPTSSPFT